MLEKNKVSIITVCYNSEKTIKDTIESVLNQTYLNIEYIIIDGNSTDTTIDIIESYETKFKEKGLNYKCVSEKDDGIYDAYNKGVSLATGSIIGIINSDDWYSNEAIKEVVKIFVDKKNTIVSGEKRKVTFDKKCMGYITIRKELINIFIKLCH